VAVKGGSEATSAGGVAAVDRALSILHAFRDGDHALALVELSRRTGLYKSTLLRLALSLERQRFLVRQEDGRFRLGSALLLLGGVYERAMDLRDLAEPVLRALADASGESATLEIREGDYRVVAMRIEGRQTVREQITPGKMMPLDRGAPGHILTRYTAPNPPAVPEIVVSLGERNPEIAGVAVPVFGVRQAFIGALVGSGTVARFSAPGRLEAMKQAVYAHARQLTETLGGDPSVYDGPRPARKRQGPDPI
jgi:DNA-binding IclR family transcriptional regulator